MKITQKIQVAVIACLLAVMFVGCSSEPSIIGTWSAQNYDQSLTMEFRSDGTWIGISEDENGHLDRIASGTWSQSGNVIYLAGQNNRDVEIYIIKSSNKNSLVVGTDDDDLLCFKREPGLLGVIIKYIRSFVDFLF